MSTGPNPSSNVLKWIRFHLGWLMTGSSIVSFLMCALSGWIASRSKQGMLGNGGKSLREVLMFLFASVLLFFLGSTLKKMKPRVQLAPVTSGDWVASIFGWLFMIGWIGPANLLCIALLGLFSAKSLPAERLFATAVGFAIIGGFVVFCLVMSTVLLSVVAKNTGSSLVDEAKALQNAQTSQHLVPAGDLTVKTQKRAKARRWTSANVLSTGLDARKLWSFNSGKNGFMVSQQATVPVAQSLPAKLVGRDWRALFQPKLNVAWLPVEQVFLRVAHLPVSNFDETLSMVELQLEKLSPLPVTQVVWSMQVLPQTVDNLQTIIIIIVARDLVEKFLGELEGQGFLADRLELPILDEILATRIAHDGAYIYPYSDSGKYSALVAWWYGGTLRNLSLLHIPMAENRDAILKEQLAQMAWSGELEGWLTGEPRWYLVANDAAAANWQTMFRPWLGQSVEVLPPLSETDLATRNANRAARAESGTGILPAEFAARYTQEFHDRLWMRGLGAIFVMYLIGVMVYMAGSSWVGMHADEDEARMHGLAREYTNTMQLKAQVDILQNRQLLKFASLDCWKTTAELLPAGITLGSLEFRDGKTLNLSGTAPGDGNGTLTDFNEAMRKATLHDKPMFEKVDLPNVRLNAGGQSLTWSFSATLANAEESQ